MRLFSCLNSTPYQPQKVLVVSRLSSLEFLRFRNPDLSDDEIFSKLSKQGTDPREIVVEHQQQIVCEQNLTAVLKKLDVRFRITKRIGDAKKCVEWADLVIPIGGHGTFLLASKIITNNVKPVFGIDPNTSNPEGNPFALPSKYTMDIESIFDKLRSGEYKSLKLSRHRKIVEGFHPRQRTLPWLALNEIFMGEFLAARPITLLVQSEDEEPFQVRSSGMCVCTGSGSRMWFKYMNAQSPDTIREIVELGTGKKLSLEDAQQLLSKYLQNIEYPIDELKMAYKIRETVCMSRLKKSEGWSDRLKCSKLKVTSHGFDAGLVIDGSLSLPFNDGTFATFVVKPEYSLKSIVLT